jgi:tetratricopeptide (TPR) repeat protein
MTSTRLLLVAALFAPSALADTIYLIDGSALDEVTVVDETMTAVTYREKGKNTDKAVEPAEVLRVEYTRKPQQVDEADSMAEEGGTFDAVALLQEFARGVLEGENKKDRQKWAPAYALQRVLELSMSAGDLQAAVAAADRLIAATPESRYVPHAYMAKARAQSWLGKQDAAQQTLDTFKGLIDEKRLPERWRLEVQLAEVLNDPSLSPSARRGRLGDVISSAGNDSPTVAARARVAEGESFLEEEQPSYDEALETFRDIVEDPGSDEATLAAAYTGIGDCLYRQASAKLQQQGLDEGLQATLQEALLSYLRVVVVYENQSRYVQQALFFSGRIFDLFGTPEGRTSARAMYRRLVANYPASDLATQAKAYL